MYIIVIVLLIFIGLLLKKLNENKKLKKSSYSGEEQTSPNNTIDGSKTKEREVPLSKEEKRARSNKRGWLFVCLLVSLIIIVLTIAVVIAESNHDEIMEATVEEKANPFGLTTDSLEALVGEKVPYDKWPIWGSPQTLEGTNNFFYAAYLDSADVSFVSNKSTDLVLFAGFGRAAAGDYLSVRQKRIKDQFGWGGAHMNLRNAVKETMNDPDSFDHVNTVYNDMGDHLVVKMTFRGANAFGGKVMNNITVKTSLDGDILDVISQNE